MLEFVYGISKQIHLRPVKLQLVCCVRGLRVILGVNLPVRFELGCGQTHRLHIKIIEEHGLLIVGPLEHIGAESGLIHQKIRDVLCMFHCEFRVVHAPVLVRVRVRVEPKLDFIDSTCNAEEGHVHPLNHRHKFLLS